MPILIFSLLLGLGEIPLRITPMKKILFAIAFLAAFSANAQKVAQLFELASDHAKEVDGQLVYENDTVQIKYSFWDEKGLVSFMINNKLQKPIYIDWEASTIKCLDYKHDLWRENNTDTLTKWHASFIYDGPVAMPGYKADPNALMGGANKARQTRVFKIMPNTPIAISAMKIFPLDYFNLGSKFNKRMVASVAKKGKTSEVIEKEFTTTSSPIRVECSFSLAASESFDNKWTVYNRFFVDKVTEMEVAQFAGATKDPKYESPYRSLTNFYIFASKAKTIEKEKK